MARTPVFVGIDVACAKRKRLPVCFAGFNGGRLEPMAIPTDLLKEFPVGLGNIEIQRNAPYKAAAKLLVSALDRTAKTQGWNLVRIAVDAPAAAPRIGERASEKMLRTLGLSSFRTPDEKGWRQLQQECRRYLVEGKPVSHLPNANKIWMLYGFQIFEAFRAATSSEVLEVYPYAIVRALMPACPHKSTLDGYLRQLNAVAAVTDWPPTELDRALQQTVPGRRHDKLDAFMAAWVASLPKSRRYAYGDEGDANDAIWVPRIGQAPTGAT